MTLSSTNGFVQNRFKRRRPKAEGWGPRRVGTSKGEGWEAQFFAFSLSRHIFLSLSSESSRGMLVFLKRRALKCPRLEFSGCRVKSWRLWGGRRGFTREPENSKTRTLKGPKRLQNSTRRPQEIERTKELWRLRKNFGQSGNWPQWSWPKRTTVSGFRV